MTSWGVAGWLGHARLRTLNLSRTRITDAALKSLGALPGLKELNLSFTQVSEDAVASFREAVPGCEVKR